MGGERWSTKNPRSSRAFAEWARRVSNLRPLACEVCRTCCGLLFYAAFLLQIDYFCVSGLGVSFGVPSLVASTDASTSSTFARRRIGPDQLTKAAGSHASTANCVGKTQSRMRRLSLPCTASAGYFE